MAVIIKNYATKNLLKHTCNSCLLGAAGFILPQLTGCKTQSYAVYKTPLTGKTVAVPLTLFATSSTVFVRPAGWLKDIAVQKKTGDVYQALLLECTHQENALTPVANGFHCSLHGSDFDKDGNVRKGPAADPLTRYQTSIEQNNLIIHV